MVPTYTTALIFGAGNGLAASLARRSARAGLQLALAVRHTARLASLVAETGAVAIRTDAADVGSVVRLFADVEPNIGTPALVVYNAGFRSRAPVTDLDRPTCRSR